MIGGLLASTLGAGFIGGIIAGFIAGYCAKAINRYLQLPQSLEALKPILIIPPINPAPSVLANRPPIIPGARPGRSAIE